MLLNIPNPFTLSKDNYTISFMPIYPTAISHIFIHSMLDLVPIVYSPLNYAAFFRNSQKVFIVFFELKVFYQGCMVFKADYLLKGKGIENFNVVYIGFFMQVVTC